MLALAGYVFEKSSCLQFDLEVKTLLDRYGLPYFHMVECAHNSDKFKHLSKDDCDKIARQMIALIRQYTLCGTAFAINQGDYRDLFPEGSFLGDEPLSDAYTYGCHTCLAVIQNWLDKIGFDGEVGYFFEAGHASASKFAALMDRIFKAPHLRRIYRYAAHGFVPKTRRPVQAADMLAWLHYIDVKNLHSPKPRPRRKDLTALIEGKMVDTKFAARSHLQNMRYQIDDVRAGWPLLTGTFGNFSPFVATWIRNRS